MPYATDEDVAAGVDEGFRGKLPAALLAFESAVPTGGVDGAEVDTILHEVEIAQRVVWRVYVGVGDARGDKAGTLGFVGQQPWAIRTGLHYLHIVRSSTRLYFLGADDLTPADTTPLAPSARMPQVRASIVFGGSAAASGASPVRVLVIGSRFAANLDAVVNTGSAASTTINTTAGLAAFDRATRMLSPDEAATQAGHGSELHHGAVAAFAQHRGAEVWIAPVTPGVGARHLADVRGRSEQHLYDADNVEKSADKSDRDLEAQLHILALALVVKPEADAPAAAVTTLFAGPEELALTLEPEEVMYLFTEWHRFQVERSPLTRADTAEEVEAFVDSLGKGVTPLSRLSSCEPATLLATACSMGLKLRSLTKPPSSATSPSNAPSDGCSPPSDSETATMTIETSEDASTR